MGARGKNFYNDVARRYGYVDEAIEIQDLYLDGKKDEAAAAVPAEWLEKSSLVGPPGVHQGAGRRLQGGRCDGAVASTRSGRTRSRRSRRSAASWMVDGLGVAGAQLAVSEARMAGACCWIET